MMQIKTKKDYDAMQAELAAIEDATGLYLADQSVDLENVGPRPSTASFEDSEAGDHEASALEVEITHLKACGYEHLSVKQYAARFAELGYTLDRSMDCRASARYLESGRSYPCCSTGLKETDTGISAWHYQDARRDDNFKAMQALRSKIFAVSRNAILEV